MPKKMMVSDSLLRKKKKKENVVLNIARSKAIRKENFHVLNIAMFKVDK